MVLVGPDGRLRRLEMIAFDEPPDYLPRPAWLAQFQDRPLDAELTRKKKSMYLTLFSRLAV